MELQHINIQYDLAIKTKNNEIDKIKNTKNQIREQALEIEERSNLKSEQEYENAISSVENSETAINLKVEKAKNNIDWDNIIF